MSEFAEKHFGGPLSGVQVRQGQKLLCLGEKNTTLPAIGLSLDNCCRYVANNLGGLQRRERRAVVFDV